MQKQKIVTFIDRHVHMYQSIKHAKFWTIFVPKGGQQNQEY